MKSKFRFVVILVIVLLMVSFSVSFAGYNTKETYFVGLHGGYSSVPGLGSFYDEYQPVSAGIFGFEGGKSWKTFELAGILDHYSINIPEGDWLQSGDEEWEATYMKYQLGMVALECLARFKFRVHPNVNPYLGVGLGLGFVYGTSEGLDYLEGPGGAKGPRETEWEDEGKPSVLPILDLMAGVRFIVHTNVSLELNVGFKEGLNFSGGATYWF